MSDFSKARSDTHGRARSGGALSRSACTGRLSAHAPGDVSNALGEPPVRPVQPFETPTSRGVYQGVVDVHRRGIGRLLLEQLVASTEAAWILTIQIGIFPANETSIRLHERLGFEIVGRRKRLGKLNDVRRDVFLVERRSELVD